MYNQYALRHYQKMTLETQVAGSSPHELVSMLLDGVLKNLHQARGAIERGDIPLKGETLGKAIRILDNLRASLDFEKGGELADNLSALYDYMERRLLKANVDSDSAVIEEVAGLIGQIREAWQAIPGDLRGE